MHDSQEPFEHQANFEIAYVPDHRYAMGPPPFVYPGPLAQDSTFSYTHRNNAAFSHNQRGLGPQHGYDSSFTMRGSLSNQTSHMRHFDDTPGRGGFGHEALPHQQRMDHQQSSARGGRGGRRSTNPWQDHGPPMQQPPNAGSGKKLRKQSNAARGGRRGGGYSSNEARRRSCVGYNEQPSWRDEAETQTGMNRDAAFANENVLPTNLQHVPEAGLASSAELKMDIALNRILDEPKDTKIRTANTPLVQGDQGKENTSLSSKPAQSSEGNVEPLDGLVSKPPNITSDMRPTASSFDMEMQIGQVFIGSKVHDLFSLWVGGLHEMTEQQVRELFAPFAPIDRIQWNKIKPGSAMIQ